MIDTISICQLFSGCQYQLRNKRDSFSSPNLHNGSYPDFQHCSWSINVNVPARILLKFQTLEVPNCKENSLDIYDGDSTKRSTLLARFCGKNATSGANVISTTNNLHIVFKSGKNFDKNTKDRSKRLQFHAEYTSLEAGIKSSLISLIESPHETLVKINYSSPILNSK